LHDTDQSIDHSRILLVFCSADGRRVHAITESGLFVTLNLYGYERSTSYLRSEAQIRTGLKCDPKGGILTLQSAELAALWEGRSAGR
jgi:hypothetical protein